MKLSRRGLLAGALGLPIVGLLGKRKPNALALQSQLNRVIADYDNRIAPTSAWLSNIPNGGMSLDTSSNWTDTGWTGPTFTLHVHYLLETI